MAVQASAYTTVTDEKGIDHVYCDDIKKDKEFFTTTTLQSCYFYYVINKDQKLFEGADEVGICTSTSIKSKKPDNVGFRFDFINTDSKNTKYYPANQHNQVFALFEDGEDMHMAVYTKKGGKTTVYYLGYMSRMGDLFYTGVPFSKNWLEINREIKDYDLKQLTIQLKTKKHITGDGMLFGVRLDNDNKDYLCDEEGIVTLPMVPDKDNCIGPVYEGTYFAKAGDNIAHKRYSSWILELKDLVNFTTEAQGDASFNGQTYKITASREGADINKLGLVEILYEGEKKFYEANSNGEVTVSDMVPNESKTLHPYAEIGGIKYIGNNGYVIASAKKISFRHEVIDKTQTSITVKLTPEEEGYPTNEYIVHCESKSYKADKDGVVKITNLQPGQDYNLYFYFKYKGEEISANSAKVSTASLNVNATYKIYPTSMLITPTYTKGDADINIARVVLNRKDYDIKPGQSVELSNLTPETTYTVYAQVEYNGRRYSKELTLKTEKVEITTQKPKIVAATSAIVAATTNLADVEAGAGFQWKKYDAPASLAPTEANAAIYSGVLEGYIKNLQPTYYQVRAFFKDKNEKYYYGEWITFDQTDYSYFEPTVHTYPANEIVATKAKVRGYWMGGTDAIVEQGIEFQIKGTPLNAASRAAAMARFANSVVSTGQVMDVELDNLKPGTTYEYRSYVLTAKGYTYGETREFTTEASSDIYWIENEVSEPEIVGYYNLQGMRFSSPRHGLNIVVYSDGSTKKIYVRE